MNCEEIAVSFTKIKQQPDSAETFRLFYACQIASTVKGYWLP